MAMAIKSPPVLRGKEALEFLERAANFTDNTPKEEAQESYRKWKAYFKRNKIFDYD
jgi:hypothetical protein